MITDNRAPYFPQVGSGQEGSIHVNHGYARYERTVQLPETVLTQIPCTFEGKGSRAIHNFESGNLKVAEKVLGDKKALKIRLLENSGRGGSRRLINQMVDAFFKSIKKSPDPLFLEGLDECADMGLLGRFAKSPYGERLYRKSVARNDASIESFLRVLGVNINHQSEKSGNTPLIAAAINCHWDMVATLLDFGAKANLLNKDRQHILQLIFQSGADKKLNDEEHDNLILKILMGQSTDKLDESINRLCVPLSIYAVTEASLKGNHRLLNILLSDVPGIIHELRHNQAGNKMLVKVVTHYGHDFPDVIDLLLQLKDSNGVQVLNPKLYTSLGETLLMLAAKFQKYNTMKTLLKDPGVMQEINKKNPYKKKIWTAYTYAHEQHNYDMMKLLQKNGATCYPCPYYTQAVSDGGSAASGYAATGRSYGRSYGRGYSSGYSGFGFGDGGGYCSSGGGGFGDGGCSSGGGGFGGGGYCSSGGGGCGGDGGGCGGF